MRILFCNDSFPGNFEALAGLMAADSANEVLFLSSFFRKDFSIPGVSRVRLRLNHDRVLTEQDAFFQAWERAYRVGRQTGHALGHLRESGFIPDMILASSADGPGLFLRHIFPESFIVSYLDRSRRTPRSQEERDRFAASLALQSYQMAQSNLFFVLSERQRGLFSPLLRHCVRIMPCFVDTEMFSPQAQAEGGVLALGGQHAGNELISLNIRGRSTESFERLFPMIAALLVRRPYCLAALCFGHEKVKIFWEQRVGALPADVRNRLCFMKFLSLTEYRNFLRTASVHVFSGMTDTPEHEILECMSCESLVMVPKTGDGCDFLRRNENFLELPDDSAKARAEAVCHALDAKEMRIAIGKKARETVLAHYRQDSILPEHIVLLQKEYEAFQKARHGCGKG